MSEIPPGAQQLKRLQVLEVGRDEKMKGENMNAQPPPLLTAVAEANSPIDVEERMDALLRLLQLAEPGARTAFQHNLCTVSGLGVRQNQMRGWMASWMAGSHRGGHIAACDLRWRRHSSYGNTASWRPTVQREGVAKSMGSQRGFQFWGGAQSNNQGRCHSGIVRNGERRCGDRG